MEQTRKGRNTAEYNIAAMVVLALDTSTRAGSVALWRDGEIDARRGDASRSHGERLPGELVSLVDAHGLSLRDVDRFAVIAGPGSFTGLRVGMATIQGLAIALSRQVVAVPTLEAMADSIRTADRRLAIGDWTDRHAIACCLDGQRGDVFFAAWRRMPDGRRGDVLIEPSVGRPEDLVSAMHTISDRAPLLVLDEGADRYRPVLAAAQPPIEIVAPGMPLAAVAARTAADRPDLASAPHALRPIYIRRPDAELARDRHHGQKAEVILGLAESSELAAVDALQRRSFSNAWGAEAIRWELEHTDVSRLYVARTSGRTVIAYCACWMVFDELHINSLAVDAPWRRHGVARLLLSHVFRESVAGGARSATLEVRQSNAAARSLYEGLGFRVEAVRRDYYQDPREDALILWNRNLTYVTVRLPTKGGGA